MTKIKIANIDQTANGWQSLTTAETKKINGGSKGRGPFFKGHPIFPVVPVVPVVPIIPVVLVHPVHPHPVHPYY
jgi:hypothetical protein